MREYVDLYGGFSDPGWKRNIFAHPSVLDGKKSHRVVLGADHAKLDGFVVRGGKARGHGGGILCLRTAPEISNNVITANTTMEPVGFVHDPGRRRHIGNDGGGIACVDAAHAVITHNLIHDNETEIGSGGGIASRDDSCPKIMFNVIYGNHTGLKDIQDTRTDNGGGISCFAGACPIISNNLIAGNRADGHSDAGAIYCEYNSSPEVTFNAILGNRPGDDGGGMEVMKGSQPKIDSNIFAGNRTYAGSGGAIRVSDCGLARITNNLIVSNEIGAVMCTNAWMVLANNTIAGNGAPRTSAVFYENERWIQLMPPIIANNIICDTSPGKDFSVGTLPYSDYPKPVLRRNDIPGVEKLEDQENRKPLFKDDGFKSRVVGVDFLEEKYQSMVTVSDDLPNQEALTGRVIHIGKRWSLVQSGSGKNLTVWGDLTGVQGTVEILPTYHLTSDSPCIDGGTRFMAPAKDFDGDPRPTQGGRSLRVDIGADEYREGK